jgi:enamine deaminase RidA (YjgF/YER057c/UK114 family)
LTLEADAGLLAGVHARRRSRRLSADRLDTELCRTASAFDGSSPMPPTSWHPSATGRAVGGNTLPYEFVVDEDLDMSIERINPDALHRPPGYHHVTIATAGRLVFLAGQCPVRQDGGVPDQHDLDEQVRVTVGNCLIALAAAGATPSDVVRAVVYVVSSDNEVLSKVWSGLLDSDLRDAFSSASTLLGVARLGFSGQRVEIDLTAALP